MVKRFNLDVILKKILKKVSILTLHKLVHTLMGWLDREKNVTFSIFAFASLTRYPILLLDTILIYLYFLLSYYKILVGFIL